MVTFPLGWINVFQERTWQWHGSLSNYALNKQIVLKKVICLYTSNMTKLKIKPFILTKLKIHSTFTLVNHDIYDNFFQSHVVSQTEKIKISNISFPRVGIAPTTCGVYSHALVPLRHDWHLRHRIEYNTLLWNLL